MPADYYLPYQEKIAPAIEYSLREGWIYSADTLYLAPLDNCEHAILAYAQYIRAHGPFPKIKAIDFSKFEGSKIRVENSTRDTENPFLEALDIFNVALPRVEKIKLNIAMSHVSNLLAFMNVFPNLNVLEFPKSILPQNGGLPHDGYNWLPCFLDVFALCKHLVQRNIQIEHYSNFLGSVNDLFWHVLQRLTIIYGSDIVTEPYIHYFNLRGAIPPVLVLPREDVNFFHSFFNANDRQHRPGQHFTKFDLEVLIKLDRLCIQGRIASKAAVLRAEAARGLPRRDPLHFVAAGRAAAGGAAAAAAVQVALPRAQIVEPFDKDDIELVQVYINRLEQNPAELNEITKRSIAAVKCGLLFTVPLDPVSLIPDGPNGKTYGREAIEQHLNRDNRAPHSRCSCTKNDIQTNWTARELIEGFIKDAKKAKAAEGAKKP